MWNEALLCNWITGHGLRVIKKLAIVSYPSLLILTHVYPSLPMLTHVYPSLPMFTHVYPSLLMFNHFYPGLP